MRTLTIFFISLFSLPLALNAQSVDEMLQKISAAIEAGQNGQAVSYFRQTIPLNIDRTEMYYWTNVDKNSEISSKLATELALAYKKNRNYDKAYLFYKELLQKAPNNVDCLEACAEMQQGQEIRNNTFHRIRYIYLVTVELNLILVQLNVAFHFREVQNTGKVERIIHIQMNPE